MKDLTPNQLKMCKLQGKFFELSAQYFPLISSHIFTRQFMNSSLASRLDRSDYSLEVSSFDSYRNEMLNQYGPTDYGQEKMDPKILYWIGFMYRYWAISEEASSKSIYKKASSKTMESNYLPFHSLDPRMVITRLEESNSELESAYGEIERTLAFMKKVRKV